MNARITFAVLAVAALQLSCGGASPGYPAYAPDRGPAYRGEAEAAPEPMARVTSADGGWFDFGDAEISGELAKPVNDSLAMRSSPPPQPSQPQPKKPEPDTQGMEKPLVVYTGYLKLRVKRLLESMDLITQRTADAGGYVESLTERVVVIRVPASDFDKVMAAFAEVGTVLDRQIKALDVTEKFTDLRGRLAVALETRKRLLTLLETVTNADERLRILQEVKRLTEQIESMESTLSTLQNLVDYYTITIELEPLVEANRQVVHRSPFRWVRALAAHHQSIGDGKGDFELTLPKGFVLFDDDDVWRAQAADTTVLRGGVLENEPRGTSAWWSDAVRHEMEGRDEELVKEGTAGGLAWRIYRNKDVQPRSWLIGVQADGEDLYVVEAFFPNEDAYARHGDAVVKALDTFRTK